MQESLVPHQKRTEFTDSLSFTLMCCSYCVALRSCDILSRSKQKQGKLSEAHHCNCCGIHSYLRSGKPPYRQKHLLKQSDLFVLRTVGKYSKLFRSVVIIKQTEKVWFRIYVSHWCKSKGSEKLL